MLILSLTHTHVSISSYIQLTAPYRGGRKRPETATTREVLMPFFTRQGFGRRFGIGTMRQDSGRGFGRGYGSGYGCEYGRGFGRGIGRGMGPCGGSGYGPGRGFGQGYGMGSGRAGADADRPDAPWADTARQDAGLMNRAMNASNPAPGPGMGLDQGRGMEFGPGRGMGFGQGRGAGCGMRRRQRARFFASPQDPAMQGDE
jgi:hypothetical protein